jgi:hypothetical protein
MPKWDARTADSSSAMRASRNSMMSAMVHILSQRLLACR